MNDLLFWFDAVRYRWKIALAGFVLVVAAVLAYSTVAASTYSAEARLLFDRDPPQLAGPDRTTTTPPEAAAAIQQTRADIILSQSVARTVAQRLALTNDADVRALWRKGTGGIVDFDAWVVEWLRGVTTVDAPRASNSATIYATAPTAPLAAAIANEFARSFIAKQLELNTEPARSYTRWLEARTGEARAQLQSTESQLAGFKRANGLVNGADLSPEVDRLQELSTQLALAEAGDVDLAARSGSRGAASAEVQQTPVIQSVRENISTKAAEVGRLSARYGDDHPTMVQARSELANLQRSLSRETSTAAASLNVSRDAAAAKRAGLSRLVNDQRARMIGMSSNLSQLALLQADTDRAQRNYDQLSQRLTQMRLQSAVPRTDVRLLDAATAPLDRASPRKSLIVALGVLLGLVTGAVIAIVLEYFDPRVRSARSLKRVTSADVVAAIPIDRHRTRTRPMTEA